MISRLPTYPKRLTRCNLTGEMFRITNVYGSSEIGIRIWLKYKALFGMRDQVLTMALENALANNRRGFYPASGVVCGGRYDTRKEMTRYDRLNREREARADRGELNQFFRRQA
jgi:hypothetical protein